MSPSKYMFKKNNNFVMGIRENILSKYLKFLQYCIISPSPGGIQTVAMATLFPFLLMKLRLQTKC